MVRVAPSRKRSPWRAARTSSVITATGSPSTTPSLRSPIAVPTFCSQDWARKPRACGVGSGGVLLPYYSAFRTAETFRMLDALYPGRVDLGIGRAPGGDARTAQAVGGVIGAAAHCRREIEAMAAGYGADEVMVLTITGDYASRTRSYERLIGAF
jgi:alkanesulfonate monooxygenase SsuD/methylene tetrahydromethanopterin reductase-like flavin-dependent oxidoreductase (luciferase family)